MKSEKQIEEMRDIMCAMIAISALCAEGDCPFDPRMVELIAAIWNALCYILEDGSPHAEAFAQNWERTLQWFEETVKENGPPFIGFNPTVVH